jgi:hypothetical protein
LMAPDERGAALPPHPPPRRLPANEWLPPRDFLPPERLPATWHPPGCHGWHHRGHRRGPATRPRGAHNSRSTPWRRHGTPIWSTTPWTSWPGAAFHARLATLIEVPDFRAWQRSNPTFKPRLSGLLWTAQGPRRITVLLDTGATHCFICAHLAAALNLAPSGQPGPGSVITAATGGTRDLAAPVQIFLSLGDVLRESLSVSPMDMDVGDDMILGWDWISEARATTCAIFMRTVRSASGPGPRCCSWTPFPRAPARRPACYR